MHCWILLTDVRTALNSFGSFGQPCGMDDLDRFECRLDLSRGWWCIFRLAFYPRLFSTPRFHISKSSLNWSERIAKKDKCTIAPIVKVLKSLHWKQSSLEWRTALESLKCQGTIFCSKGTFPKTYWSSFLGGEIPSPSCSLVAASWLGSWTVGWLASLAPTTINANLASNFFLQESLHSPESRSATCTGAELLLGMHPPSLASRHSGKTVDEAYSMTRISTFPRELWSKMENKDEDSQPKPL